MLTLAEVVAKSPSELSAEEVAFLKEHASELTDEQKATFSEVLADGEGIDEEALKSLISKSATEILAKKVDEMSDQLVAKFMTGVAAQRKRAIDTGKPANDKHHDSTRDFMKALFSGDSNHLKVNGYVDTNTASAGYSIPVELQAEVLRIANTQYGLARRDFRYLPFSGPGNTRTIPALGSSVSVSWTDEGGKKDSTKPVFSLVTQTLKKLAAIVPMTDEVLEDSAVNLTQLIAELFAEAVAQEEDIQFFAGTGSPWTGILNNSNVNTVDMATDDVHDVTADDLLDLIDATPTGALKGSKFYLSRSALSLIRKLKSSDTGTYIFQAPGQSQPGTIWDYPYEVSDAFPAVADVGAEDPFIMFGNLKVAAIFGDKQQLRVKLLTEATVGNTNGSDSINLAEQDMTAIRIVERVGYVLALPKAVSVLKVGASS